MTGFTVDSSPETAARVLWGLFGWAHDLGELTEMSVKTPSGKWNSEHVDIARICDLSNVKQMGDWSRRGREMYVGAVGLKEKPKVAWRRGGAALRGHAGALWVDVDVEAPGREGPKFFASIKEAIDGVDKALGPELADASVVIGSGWGVQYWIPLRDPVEARVASQAVRVLIGMLAEKTEKKIDRVWDVTRVMRMPGTWNWRAGPDPAEAMATGVIRWPLRRAHERLSVWNVIDDIARNVDDVGSADGDDLSRLATPDKLQALLERYGGVGGAEDSDPGARALGEWIGDIERIAYESLTWEDVLLPYGWRCVSGSAMGLGHDEHEQVWERPGKLSSSGSFVSTGERSAVVYADRSELLVVYSDSPDTGFHDGLRGAGHRGEGAGVGVISHWRAWVDLAYEGDADKAFADVTNGRSRVFDGVAEVLTKAWISETEWMSEWVKSLDRWGDRKVAGWVDP